MLSSEKWWGVISNYNQNIFPLQFVVLFIGIAIVAYLFLKPEGKGGVLLKGYFGLCNLWIGIVFFNIMGKDFPTPFKQIQGALFIIIGILFIVDIFTKQTVFQIPQNKNAKSVTVLLLLTVLVYPVIGVIAGRPLERLIFPGTLPCATTAFALVLLSSSVKRANKPIYILLLIWAIPFPPLIQIPKYHVYEDSIMFLVGIYALAVILIYIYNTKKRLDLKKHKNIFSFTNDSVFATSSADYIPNIIPIHSKHLVPGNKVLISDQFMNKTKSNIMDNPNGTLMIKDSGWLYKISGVCKYKTSGFMYNKAVKGAEKYARENAKNKNISIKCKGIVLMNVNNVEITAID